MLIISLGLAFSFFHIYEKLLGRDYNVTIHGDKIKAEVQLGHFNLVSVVEVASSH